MAATRQPGGAVRGRHEAEGERAVAGAAREGDSSRRAWWIGLGLTALAALAIRASTAVAFPNIVWPDEIYQSLEQAHRLAFGSGVVPWEFRDGTRSWLLPGALAGAMALAPGEGGTLHLRVVQLLLCVLSLAPIAVAYATAARARGTLAAVIAGGAAAVWFELILFAPKALNEVVAAHLLLLGLYLEATVEQGRRRLLAGALLGAAVALRIHLALAVLLALAWSAGRDWRRWRALLPGLAAMGALAGLVDLVTWGRPFHSFVSTIQFNVVRGKAAEFGTAPWSGYLEAIWTTWSWATFVVVPLALLGARRLPALAIGAVTVLATHTAFAHKEYRFVYPAILLAITLAAIGTAELLSWIGARARLRSAWLAAALLLLWSGLSLARGLRYETTAVDPLTPAPTSRWTHAGWGLESMALAGAKPDLCGVGLVLTSWIWTGGYTYLHRDVPIFLVVDQRDGIATAGGFNAVIAPAQIMPNLPEFTVRRCWPEGMCFADRPGACRPVQADQINDRLRSWGA